MNQNRVCILFDGYPRNRAQAAQLDSIFIEVDMTLHGVIAIMVDPEELIVRITARRTCATCHTIINLALLPANTLNECPTCGGNLIQREDDNEEVVRHRIEGYHHDTVPLLDYYGKRGIVHRVAGQGKVTDVGARVADALAVIKSQKPDAAPGMPAPAAKAAD